MFKRAAKTVGSGQWVVDRKPFLAILLFTLYSLLSTSCLSTPPVLKIALVAPFEGEHRAIGYDAIYSARLAVREINEQGGINGRKIALVALDDAGDVQLAQETAASLTLDPDVIAVVGHWRPDTSTAAAPIYNAASLTLITLGQPPFTPLPPDQLPNDFQPAYAAVTPFDEVADRYAGSTYDAFQLIFIALEKIANQNQTFTRQNMHISLQNLEVEGITGTVYLNTPLNEE